MGENTIAIDCDVLQADGGTRTASITGAYVALCDAVTYLGAGQTDRPAADLVRHRRGVVGVVDGRVRLDLPYEEDSRAEVDMNVVATDTGTLVEVQGTGEGATFPRTTLDWMLDSALAARRAVRRAEGGAGRAVPRRAARGSRLPKKAFGEADPLGLRGKARRPAAAPAAAGLFSACGRLAGVLRRSGRRDQPGGLLRPVGLQARHPGGRSSRTVVRRSPLELGGPQPIPAVDHAARAS